MSNGVAAQQTLEGAPPHVAWHPLRACYDLAFLIGLALLLPLLPLPLLRVPLGLLLVLIGPGYVLQAALFTRRAELEDPMRLAVSFGLSVAVLPVLALILDALPWGIRARPIEIALTTWLVLWSSIAGARRYRLRAADAAALPPRVRMPNPARTSPSLLAVIGVLTCVAGGIGWVIVGSQAAQPPTEFYALGAENLAEDYPREVAPGQPMQVQLGIHNREGTPVRYRIEVRAGAEQLAQIGPLALADGATWQQTVQYTLAQIGDDQSVDLLLYREHDSAPYRQLRLWINVRGQ